MGDHPQITIQVHPTPPGENFRAYTVRFFHHRQIRTTLTSNVEVVEHWVSMIWNRYLLLRNPLLVGFGVFWTQTFPPAPQGRAATIQICIDGFCLIWQLREVVPFGVPHIVQQFFLHPDVRLVGVDNGMHAPLLREHHGIQANPRDLRYLAVARLGDFRLATESTMRVASAVFQFEVPETPFDVFLSNWDAPVLAPRQVLHAAVYAFVSYRIGMVLHAYDWIWDNYLPVRNPLLLGFGVFWPQTFPPAPQGRAATIQICIDGFCLIWQLREVVPFGVPHIVQQFFLHPDVHLVGVDNEMHAQLLREHHGIQANPRDLRNLAVDRLGDFRLATESTMRVASAVFQFEVPETPFDVFLSNWDAPVLAPRQVLHAAVYAFVSYRIGMVLHAYDW